MPFSPPLVLEDGNGTKFQLFSFFNIVRALFGSNKELGGVSFLHWFITSNLVFWTLSLTLHVKYIYVLTTNLFYIIYILCIHALYHINMNIFFVKTTFSKSIICRVKSTFEPNVFKLVI